MWMDVGDDSCRPMKWCGFAFPHWTRSPVVNQVMSSPSVGVVEGSGGSQKTIAANVLGFAGLLPGRSIALTLV